ncbi:uncharacterized protein LOC114473553 [Gouania willdenowi]|uniref:uncharacterized protein LOC114473553 n=1 Tax=Gouania willdenowi TaxID=441366 RepID=UPI00105581EF|nr:uncharacterized protein LOC114473553 [Gouania willdenowi]
MPLWHHFTRREAAGPGNTSSVLLSIIQPVINPKSRMDEPLLFPSPPPPRSCNSSASVEKWCWNLDVRLLVLLVTVVGALVLLLLYKFLHLRHRLRLAQARHALEYFSFYHCATYTLKQATPLQDTPTKNGCVPKPDLPPQTTAITPTPATAPTRRLSCSPLPPLPPPAPPIHALVLPVLSVPLPLPVPPSPHLSWGACSDADVYSRIGAFRPSRLSSQSSQSTVILFEHSSL